MALLIAFSAILVFYSKAFTANPSIQYIRLRQLYRKQIQLERRMKRGGNPRPSLRPARKLCARCTTYLSAGPTLEDVRNALHGGGEVPAASTGCELTDQIFAAARKKGIVPVDVIGPAPDYDD